jgi:hypothetical protein
MSDITDEMIRAGAAAMWGSPERDAMKISRMVLGAALAGRVVVDLPERDAINSHQRHGTWIIDGDLEVSFTAFLHWSDNSPTVEVSHERGGTEEWGTEALRAFCLAGLAACEFADRLAAEQSSGVAGGGVR